MRNKSILKYWPHLFIIVFDIVIGQTIIYFINKGSTDSQFLIDLITRILDIFIAILNFVVVVYIFKKEQEEKNINKQEEYNMFWYQTYILPNTINQLKRFFECIELLIESGLDMTEEHKDNYMEYTKKHNECKKNITELLNIVSNNTYTKIINVFKEFQDEFNTKLYNQPEKNELKNIVASYKHQMFDCLYKYDKS